ncbi:hypothetical protein ACA910_000797 [Epithemia clementina (nom. ined.)]
MASTTLKSTGAATDAGHPEHLKAFSEGKGNDVDIKAQGGVPGSSAPPSVEEALSAMETMVRDGRLTSEHDKTCLKVLLSDHDALKDKISKLKSLLGRSAKAQRESKIELETTQKRLQETTREVERLNQKVEKLASRPTHMELLADFETNFDRALLSVNQQAGGESTAAPTSESPGRGRSSNATEQNSAVVDDLLLQELQESKQRIEKLESLNEALLNRSSQLETEVKNRRRERDELQNRVTHLELEKRMAVMEAEHATKAMQEKAASLAEMQMEIDLVSKASVKAQLRAAKDEELIKSVKTDQKHVHQLEAQVHALQEWATAAAEAKTLAQERVRLLEAQVRSLKEGGPSGDLTRETILWEKKGSFVIGAGDFGYRIFECDSSMTMKSGTARRLVLRWQFDLTAEDLSVEFSAFQGRCESKDDRKKAIGSNRALIENRVVKGGAAGELDDAFFYQDTCTLFWSNLKSWVRPRTVRYTIQAVSISVGAE